MMTPFHYLRDGQRFGPMSGNQLKQAAASGNLRSHDLVWSPKFPGWTPARKVKGLFASARPTPPPLPVGLAVRKAVPPPLPGRNRSIRWYLFSGAAVMLIAVVGASWLLTASAAPAADDRRTERPMDEKKESTTIAPESKEQRPADNGKKVRPVKEEPRNANPEAARALERGNAALNKGDLDKALREYSEAIRLQPDCALAWCKRGQIHMNRREYPKAIADCDQALKFEPRMIEALACRAGSQLDGGDHEGAIASSTQALKLNGKEPYFYYIRGTAQIHKGGLDRAIDDLSEAIRLDGKNPNFFNNRGIAYERRGEREKAAADYDRRDALLGKPTMSAAKREAKARYDQARAAFEEVRKLHDLEEDRISRERRMRIPSRPIDPALSMRFNGAFKLLEEARRVYEQTK
jgi:tetratricopeptide (TPR) repeat protein